MANFIGWIDNGRSQVSRLGHSEIEVEARSWNIGYAVRLYKEGKDIHVRIIETGGSNNPDKRKDIKNFKYTNAFSQSECVKIEE